MPRSGVGLNELLAPPRKTKRDDAMSADRSSAELLLTLDEKAERLMNFHLQFGHKSRRTDNRFVELAIFGRR